MKKKTDKNKLVKKYLEHCNDYSRVLGKKDRGRGIYVLYKGDRIYYVGLSKSSLKSRITSHATKKKHKGKWDNFSFYQIGRTKFIKDIETLFLRVCNPRGSESGGRFKKKYDLSKNCPDRPCDNCG